MFNIKAVLRNGTSFSLNVTPWQKNISSITKFNVLGQRRVLNPLTPRVKPWVIQRFLTFDSMDRTLKCPTICWKAVDSFVDVRGFQVEGKSTMSKVKGIFFYN